MDGRTGLIVLPHNLGKKRIGTQFPLDEYLNFSLVWEEGDDHCWEKD